MKLYAFLIFALVNFCGICGESFANTKTIYSTLADFYANNQKPLTNIIPAEDLSQPIELQLTMYLYSVDGFDAVTGQVEITGSVYIEWKDQTKESSVGNFDFSFAEEGYSITISPDKIWTPSIVLLNAVDTIKNVGSPAYKARYQLSDGRVMWHSRAIIKASCTPDTTYYPFDRQTCSFIYTAWGYTTSEIQLVGGQSDWYLCDYVPNGLWALVETSAEQYDKNDESFIKFTFTIERQPMFFILNVVCPILLLGFLNGFVFLMPADCGERVGFNITCFLTMVFMLQTVMSFLPQTAEPMSIFCFYTVIMMVFSIFSCIVTVIMLRLYHKPADSKVPKIVQRFIRVVTCVWMTPMCRACCKVCRKPNLQSEDGSSFSFSSQEPEIGTNTKSFASVDRIPLTETNPKVFINVKSAYYDAIPSTSTSSNDSTASSSELLIQETDDTEHEYEDVAWSEVGKVLDLFFFLAFLGAQAAVSVIFLVPLATGASS